MQVGILCLLQTLNLPIASFLFVACSAYETVVEATPIDNASINDLVVLSTQLV